MVLLHQQVLLLLPLVLPTPLLLLLLLPDVPRALDCSIVLLCRCLVLLLCHCYVCAKDWR